MDGILWRRQEREKKAFTLSLFLFHSTREEESRVLSVKRERKFDMPMNYYD